MKHPVNLTHTTFGQKAAERMAKIIGSWRFLAIQTCILFCWIVLNTWLIITNQWDQYPYILLNLMLSFQAAYTGPILLIASNRSTERDRQVLEHEAEQTEQHTEMLKVMQQLLEENTKLTRELHGRTIT